MYLRHVSYDVMTLTTRHTLYASVIVVGALFVLTGILTNWFDGIAEDNSDRDEQRKIFCEGRCMSGQNAVDLPCKHPDVAPPRTEILDGPKLCKDSEWKLDSIIDVNRIKTTWDEAVEEENAKQKLEEEEAKRKL